MEALDRGESALEGLDEAGRQRRLVARRGGEGEAGDGIRREAVELPHRRQEGAVAAGADIVDQRRGLLERLLVEDRLAAPDEAFQSALTRPGGELDDAGKMCS